MTDPELLDAFITITQAPPHVAEHLLEAHGQDLDAAVDFYLESGGVGHGSDAFAHHATGQPLPASAAPRSSPIDLFGDEDEGTGQDDDIEVLASTLGRRAGRRLADDDEEDVRSGGRHGAGPSEEIDLVDSEDERGPGRRPAPRRVRRNRPRGAAEADRDLATLGRLNGVIGGAAPPSGPAPSGAPGDAQRDGIGGGSGGADDVAMALPPDVDLEEQRMLLAAMTGAAYEGRVPDFGGTDPRYRPRALSPASSQREQLRREQDAAYHESLAEDRRKAEAAEAAAREAAAAEARERAEAERAERAQRDEEEARERRLRSKEAALPPEPGAEAEGAVVIVVRMPQGGRLRRRFLGSDRLKSVFDFVDVAGQGAEVQPGSYNLVSQFPRRVFEDGGSRTLAEANLVNKQEALFIEMKD